MLEAAVVGLGFKFEAAVGASRECGSGWAWLGIPPPREMHQLELERPPPAAAATGSTARGGASGQCQPQPYGINFIGGLSDILGLRRCMVKGTNTVGNSSAAGDAAIESLKPCLTNFRSAPKNRDQMYNSRKHPCIRYIRKEADVSFNGVGDPHHPESAKSISCQKDIAFRSYNCVPKAQ